MSNLPKPRVPLQCASVCFCWSHWMVRFFVCLFFTVMCDMSLLLMFMIEVLKNFCMGIWQHNWTDFCFAFLFLFLFYSSLDLLWRSCVCISMISTTNIEWWYYFKLCLRTVQYYVFASQSTALKSVLYTWSFMYRSCIHDRSYIYSTGMDCVWSICMIHVWILTLTCQGGTLKDNHTQTYLL